MDNIAKTADLEQTRLLCSELPAEILGLLNEPRELRQLTPNRGGQQRKARTRARS